MLWSREGRVETEVVGCQAAMRKPNLQALEADCLAVNNRETTPSQCILPFDKTLMKPRNKKKKATVWVFNSLLPHPMQGAGNDWWERFPAGLWDWRKNWQCSVWGLRYESKHYLFRHTFPHNNNHCFHTYIKEINKSSLLCIGEQCAEKYTFYKRMWKQCWTV